jgi:hypothetical protein
LPQSKYPVLHKEAFGSTRFLSFGRFGSRASSEKKIGPIMSNFLGRFFHVFRGKKNEIILKTL